MSAVFDRRRCRDMREEEATIVIPGISKIPIDFLLGGSKSNVDDTLGNQECNPDEYDDYENCSSPSTGGFALKISANDFYQPSPDIIQALRPGILRSSRSSKNLLLQLISRSKGGLISYVPCKEDNVIGIVTGKHGEDFIVDIGGAHGAVLPMMTGFEGATKRNRPNLIVGSLVYCRVSDASKDIDPEIVCVSAHGKTEGYGELKDGHLFNCSSFLAMNLTVGKSTGGSSLLSMIGKVCSFELAVGMNGRIWIRSPSPRQTIILADLLLQSEAFLNNQDSLQRLVTLTVTSNNLQ